MALCVDDDQPPFSYVLVEGTVEVSEDLDEMLAWATVSAAGTWAKTTPRRSAGAPPCPASCWCG